MLIGFHPGAALRAIGEVDYENARIVAGRAFTPEDREANVAIVGKLYAAQAPGACGSIRAHARRARAEAERTVLSRRGHLHDVNMVGNEDLLPGQALDKIRAIEASASRSPERSLIIRRSFSPTSRPGIWIPARAR
jgi:hypothetical protein